MISFHTTAATLALCGALAACGGGGDNQQVTELQAGNLAYGQRASIQIAGVDLRASMSAQTGLCKDPVFNAAQSVPQLAVLNCTVTTTGEQPITIVGSNGQVLFQGQLSVPEPRVLLNTSMGNVVLQLDPAVAPVTVNNFLAYVGSGYYTNTLFHRVISGFVAQGGGYTAGLVKKTGQQAPIALESNKGLSNSRGSLAMARTVEPDSATSEFFINLADNTSLDYQSPTSPGYAVFGKVVQGQDIVDAMAAMPTGTVDAFADVPVTDITIKFALRTQ